MPNKFIPPQTTTTIRTSATPLSGEILFDTDEKKLYYGDGVTDGGLELGSGGVTFKGTWNSATNYVQYDAVEYDGSAYIANDANLNKTPGIDPEWDLWVEKGNTGTVSASTGLTLEHITTPSDPGAGNTIVYAKSDGKIYKLSAGGSEEKIGGSGGNASENVVINGRFDVWQLGTSFANIQNLAITADRWKYGQVSGTAQWTIARSTDTPNNNLNYSLMVSCTTADTGLGAGEESHIRYGIEGTDFRQFVGKIATLNFWVKSNKTGVYCVAFTNSTRDRTYLAEYTINSANTWEEKTIQITFDYSGGTWDYTTGLGLGIRFAFRCGTTYQGTVNTWNSANVVGTANQVNLADSNTNTWQIADVSFTLGEEFNGYNCEPIANTLSKCQRYLRVIGCTTAGVNAALFYGGGGPDSANTDVFLNTPMRVAPIVTMGGTINTDYDLQNTAGVDIGITSITNFSRSPSYLKFSANKTGGFTTGTPYYLRFKTTDAKIIADAEL